MEIDWASVLPALVTVGAIMATWWRLDAKMEILDAKIERVDIKLSGETTKVREASETAHKEIRADLADIKVEQGKHSERFNVIDLRSNCIDDKIDNIASAVG